MRRVVFLVGLVIFSLACSLITPVSTPNVPPASVTQDSPVPPTFTPIPTFTSAPPTVQPPPPAVAPGNSYVLSDERIIDGYAVRFWHDSENQSGFNDIVLIETASKPAIRVDMASALGDLTGTDINGDGYPDVIVETFSGGAHCCFGTQVFSLRPTNAALILQKPESNAGGQFQDLNGDGIFEFITYDDTFAYQYCPYAAGVFVKVVMEYDAAQDRYAPASPRFSDQYREDITQNEGRALSAPGEFGEWDGTNACAILPLVLDYLYIGQQDQAHMELVSRYSDPAKAESFWNEVLLAVQGSPLYTP